MKEQISKSLLLKTELHKNQKKKYSCCAVRACPLICQLSEIQTTLKKDFNIELTNNGQNTFPRIITFVNSRDNFLTFQEKEYSFGNWERVGINKTPGWRQGQGQFKEDLPTVFKSSFLINREVLKWGTTRWVCPELYLRKITRVRLMKAWTSPLGVKWKRRAGFGVVRNEKWRLFLVWVDLATSPVIQKI